MAYTRALSFFCTHLRFKRETLRWNVCLVGTEILLTYCHFWQQRLMLYLLQWLSPRAVKAWLSGILDPNHSALNSASGLGWCHWDKSYASKALICESLFPYLASFSIQSLLSSCSKNVYFFNSTPVTIQDPLPCIEQLFSKELSSKEFWLAPPSWQWTLDPVCIKTVAAAS